jgi:hypothetical protein
MAVNHNLAELMRVIEDNQDKITEGEYLAAMNALGALHREIPVPMAVVAAPPPPAHAAAAAAAPRAIVMPPGMEDRVEQAAWYRVMNDHPEHHSITPDEWIEFSVEERKIFVREATEIVVNRLEACCRNPEPEECPFIARHAVGRWCVIGVWECVCGYKGYCRNWQRHEQGERHQEWAKHRTVSRRKIERMKCEIRRDEEGELCRYNPLSQTDFGGIRCFVTRQERNEWTHPELYTESQRNPIPMPTASGIRTTWFVHPRPYSERVYVLE